MQQVGASSIGEIARSGKQIEPAALSRAAIRSLEILQYGPVLIGMQSAEGTVDGRCASALEARGLVIKKPTFRGMSAEITAKGREALAQIGVARVAYRAVRSELLELAERAKEGDDAR